MTTLSSKIDTPSSKNTYNSGFLSYSPPQSRIINKNFILNELGVSIKQHFEKEVPFMNTKASINSFDDFIKTSPSTLSCNTNLIISDSVTAFISSKENMQSYQMSCNSEEKHVLKDFDCHQNTLMHCDNHSQQDKSLSYFLNENSLLNLPSSYDGLLVCLQNHKLWIKLLEVGKMWCDQLTIGQVEWAAWNTVLNAMHYDNLSSTVDEMCSTLKRFYSYVGHEKLNKQDSLLYDLLDLEMSIVLEFQQLIDNDTVFKATGIWADRFMQVKVAYAYKKSLKNTEICRSGAEPNLASSYFKSLMKSSCSYNHVDNKNYNPFLSKSQSIIIPNVSDIDYTEKQQSSDIIEKKTLFLCHCKDLSNEMKEQHISSRFFNENQPIRIIKDTQKHILSYLNFFNDVNIPKADSLKLQFYKTTSNNKLKCQKDFYHLPIQDDVQDDFIELNQHNISDEINIKGREVLHDKEQATNSELSQILESDYFADHKNFNDLLSIIVFNKCTNMTFEDLLSLINKITNENIENTSSKCITEDERKGKKSFPNLNDLHYIPLEKDVSNTFFYTKHFPTVLSRKSNESNYILDKATFGTTCKPMDTKDEDKKRNCIMEKTENKITKNSTLSQIFNDIKVPFTDAKEADVSMDGNLDINDTVLHFPADTNELQRGISYVVFYDEDRDAWKILRNGKLLDKQFPAFTKNFKDYNGKSRYQLNRFQAARRRACDFLYKFGVRHSSIQSRCTFMKFPAELEAVYIRIINDKIKGAS